MVALCKKEALQADCSVAFIKTIGQKMRNELRSSGHAFDESNLHLQFTPAYLQYIFGDPLVRELTVAYIVQRAQEMRVEIAAIECGSDHLHIFAKNWKNWKISVLAGQRKTY